MEGKYIVKLHFLITDEFQSNPIENNDAFFFINLETRILKFDNQPPYYNKEVPTDITMRLGDKWEFESGIPSNDTIEVSFGVTSQNRHWTEFITATQDPETHEILIQIEPR